MKSNEKIRKWFFPISLIIILAVLTAAVIPDGYVYGSNTDWLSQHVTLAESIRTACLEQHTLLPAWIGLGGGSNGYQFSYYGFLRPDIITGCLLPHIPMAVIIISYMQLLYAASVLLCFLWLRVEKLPPASAWLGAMLFMTAGCMFHMHRQIMFVNYLPFLLLAFLCVAKQKFKLLPLCLLLICLHSFYFAISAFTAVGWYWYQKEGSLFLKKSLGRYAASVLLASGMAGALLLPTGLALLEHRSGGSTPSLLALFGPNVSMNNLLFNEYGMGLSMICFYAILIGLQYRRLRRDSILFLLFGLFGIFSWILNGTLYARPKILIPFMPLLALHCIRCITLHKRVCSCCRIRFLLWPFALMIPMGILWTLAGQPQGPWSILETVLLLLLCLLSRGIRRSGITALPKLRRRLASLSVLLLAAAPVGMYVATARTEDWVARSDLTAGLTSGETDQISFHPLYHFDSLVSPLVSGNKRNGDYTRSTMYSSVTSQAYSSLYYDTLLTPIRINNRVALLTSDNPFLLQLLGVRYLETDRSHIPLGYEAAASENTDDTVVIAENKNVLPTAYFTADTIPQNWFDQRDPLEKLDLITRKTVVDTSSLSGISQTGGHSALQSGSSAESQSDPSFDCAMEDFSPEISIAHMPDGLRIEQTADGYDITAEHTCTLKLAINNPVSGKILLLDFAVENLTRQAVVIDINTIRNKLSGAFAPYPNGNTRFHYQFSPESEYDSGQGVNLLEITFSAGHYCINSINWHQYDQTLLTAKEYTPVQPENSVLGDSKASLPGSGNSASACPVLSGTVTAGSDGYLATAIPLQNGLQIYVDGKLQPVIRVNEAFAGTPLTQGTHRIDILFTPPGQKAGYIISVLSAAGYILWFSFRRIRQTVKHKNSKRKKESL